MHRKPFVTTAVVAAVVAASVVGFAATASAASTAPTATSDDAPATGGEWESSKNRGWSFDDGDSSSYGGE
ncbi:hypothetical protein [Pseudonocardia sp. TRM90224]|uniref:hypothetical protein n=1 Tax=Pseudonocardia sp. TRM90224 TaxID=2812678 RepID=UPI001E32B221|nr:hypothetical protein [Pseudonocardia sp. TRM90224]